MLFNSETINPGKIGLVYKDETLVKVITTGKYRTKWGERLKQYDMADKFQPVNNLRLLLKDAQLTKHLSIVNVADHQIALCFEDGNFKELLKPGQHVYWKGLVNYTFVIADLSKPEIEEAVLLALMQNAALAPYIRSFKVEAYEKGILFIDGQPQKELAPGQYYFWRNAIGVTVEKVDVRHTQLEVSGQEILTKDKAGLRISCFVQYKVVDMYKAVAENKNYERQLYIITQLALRAYVGNLSLDELLEGKEAAGEYILSAIKSQCVQLGVVPDACGIRDIILPGEMRDIMNQVIMAQKQAQANVIMRREETASTRSLLNTAKLMEENELLFKLKEMEYVEKIAEKIGEVSVSGNGQVLDQLKHIFSVKQ